MYTNSTTKWCCGKKHKHLLELSRALLFQSHLPLTFWGECVLTATYLINRIYLVALNNKSPFELLYNKQPSYDHLRIFGCPCYMSTLKQGRDTFQTRVVSYVILGYPHGKKANKVMTLDTHKFYTSKDVIFHEHIFPFSASTHPSLFPSSLNNTVASFEPQLVQHHELASSQQPQVSENSNLNTNHDTQQSRRSPITHKIPGYLHDYVCTAHTESSCFGTLTNLCSQPPTLSVHYLSTTSQ